MRTNDLTFLVGARRNTRWLILAFLATLFAALIVVLLASGCAGEGPRAPSAESEGDFSSGHDSESASTLSGDTASRAASGWRQIGEFEGYFSPSTGLAHLEMVEPNERKTASQSIPGMAQNLRSNEESDPVAGRVRFLQDASGNGQTVGDCEDYWQEGWLAGNEDWHFWLPASPAAIRNEFLTDLAGDQLDNRFCTNFELTNDVGRPLHEVWIIVDGITIPTASAWVQALPRVIPSQVDGEPDTTLEPNSSQGMFRYGDFAEDQSETGQWYFTLGGAALGDFRVRGRIVELLREQCATGADDNGDGLVDSGCFQFHAGADCSMNQDCVSGDCDGGVPIDPRSPGSGELGSCQPSPELGACFVNTDCVGGHTCIGADPGEWIAGVCQADGGGVVPPTGDSCTQDVDCATGLCDPVLFECRQPLGAICTVTTDCVGDAFCEGFPEVCTPGFVTLWNTANVSDGSSESHQLHLPLTAAGSYGFTVNWGDGSPAQTVSAWDQAEVTHTYATPGVYTVEIRGEIDGWRFDGQGDRLKLLEISSFGPLRLGNEESYFRGAQNLEITATDVLDLSGTASLLQAFADCSSLTTVPSVNAWDTSSVDNMAYVFNNASAFNQPVDSWDTSGVTSMVSMFNGASTFNQPIDSWNTASLSSMAFMFSGAGAFNQPIDSWNTTGVTNMTYMFNGASAFDQLLGGWDTSGVANMAHMFHGATAFNGPVGNWNTSSVSNMAHMFDEASAFDQPLDGWDFSSVTHTTHMFHGAAAFNRPIGSWDISGTASMTHMFHGASAFNQPLDGWETSGVTHMGGMFMDATSFNQDLSSWCVTHIAGPPADFDAGAAAWVLALPQWGTCPGDEPVGTPCTEITGCAEGSLCDPVLFECRQALGEPCAFSSDCVGNAFCEGSPEVCTPVFVSWWDTTIISGGSSASNQVRLPLTIDGSYDFTVDWGDGSPIDTITDGEQAEVTHTYAIEGEYVVEIRGDIEGWRFNDDGDRLKLLEITAFGPLRLGNEDDYFHGAENLNIAATDVLDLSGTTSLVQAFRGCTSLATVPSINAWDTSGVTSMGSMFEGASAFNQPLDNWDTSGVTDMGGLFDEASSFNQSLSDWCVTHIGSQPDGFDADATSWVLSRPLWGTCPGNEPLGTACTADTDCATGVCDPVLLDCRQPHGEPCATFADCVGNAFCEGSEDVCTRVFVTRWDTTNSSAGSSGNNQVRLPLTEAGSYNFGVDWGDGSPVQTVTAWNQAQVTHTYAAPGEYTVEIRGEITGWRFNNGGDRLKLLEIAAFGPLRLGNEGDYFHGAGNLEITATEVLDLTGTTNLQRAFRACGSLTTAPSMNTWDTSSVTTMRDMFLGSSAFNQNLAGWDVSSVTHHVEMMHMFRQAPAFNQNLSGWCVSHLDHEPPGFDFGASAWTNPNWRPLWGTCPD